MQCVDDNCIQFIPLLLTCPNKNIIFKRKRGYTCESENCFFSLSTEVCCNKCFLVSKHWDVWMFRKN